MHFLKCEEALKACKHPCAVLPTYDSENKEEYQSTTIQAVKLAEDRTCPTLIFCPFYVDQAMSKIGLTIIFHTIASNNVVIHIGKNREALEAAKKLYKTLFENDLIQGNVITHDCGEASIGIPPAEKLIVPIIKAFSEHGDNEQFHQLLLGVSNGATVFAQDTRQALQDTRRLSAEIKTQTEKASLANTLQTKAEQATADAQTMIEFLRSQVEKLQAEKQASETQWSEKIETAEQEVKDARAQKDKLSELVTTLSGQKSNAELDALTHKASEEKLAAEVRALQAQLETKNATHKTFEDRITELLGIITELKLKDAAHIRKTNELNFQISDLSRKLRDQESELDESFRTKTRHANSLNSIRASLSLRRTTQGTAKRKQVTARFITYSPQDNSRPLSAELHAASPDTFDADGNRQPKSAAKSLFGDDDQPTNTSATAEQLERSSTPTKQLFADDLESPPATPEQSTEQSELNPDFKSDLLIELLTQMIDQTALLQFLIVFTNQKMVNEKVRGQLEQINTLMTQLQTDVSSCKQSGWRSKSFSIEAKTHQFILENIEKLMKQVNESIKHIKDFPDIYYFQEEVQALNLLIKDYVKLSDSGKKQATYIQARTKANTTIQSLNGYMHYFSGRFVAAIPEIRQAAIIFLYTQLNRKWSLTEKSVMFIAGSYDKSISQAMKTMITELDPGLMTTLQANIPSAALTAVLASSNASIKAIGDDIQDLSEENQIRFKAQETIEITTALQKILGSINKQGNPQEITFAINHALQYDDSELQKQHRALEAEIKKIDERAQDQKALLDQAGNYTAELELLEALLKSKTSELETLKREPQQSSDETDTSYVLVEGNPNTAEHDAKLEVLNAEITSYQQSLQSKHAEYDATIEEAEALRTKYANQREQAALKRREINAKTGIFVTAGTHMLIDVLNGLCAIEYELFKMIGNASAITREEKFYTDRQGEINALGRYDALREYKLTEEDFKTFETFSTELITNCSVIKTAIEHATKLLDNALQAKKAAAANRSRSFSRGSAHAS